MWSNDIKCKYMFKFPLKILARKGLNIALRLTVLERDWSVSHWYIDGLVEDSDLLCGQQ